MLIASSSSVYGANKNLPFKEIDKTETQLSIYAATKKSTESIAHSYSNIWKTTNYNVKILYSLWSLGKTRHGIYLVLQNKLLNKKKIEIFITREKCFVILLILTI